MFHDVPGVSKTPAGRRFEQVAACCIMCLLSPKHLQADVLSSFHTLGLSLLLCAIWFMICSKHRQADVLSTFSTLRVKFRVVHHVVRDVFKTPAGRRFEQFFLLWG